MTPAEAQVLLSMASAFDNRKPDADAAKAWSAALDDLRFEDCRVALIAHFKTSNDWLMPAMIRTSVRRMRSSRLEDHPPLTPPPDLTPLQTIAWRKGMNQRVADGEQIDPDAAYGELKPRNLGDLRSLMPTPDAPADDDADTTTRRVLAAEIEES